MTQLHSKEVLSKMETVMALESIVHYLKKENSKHSLNASGLKMANVAIESICANSHVKSKSLAFALEGVDAVTDDVFNSGVESVGASIDSVWIEIEHALALTFTSVTEKMQVFKQRVSNLQAELVRVEALVASKETAQPPSADGDNRLLGRSDTESYMYSLVGNDGQVPQFGEGICKVIDDVLLAHAGAFTAYVDKQIEWLKSNAEKLAGNLDVFNSAPVDEEMNVFLILDSSKVQTENGELTYCSKTLPGGNGLYFNLGSENALGGEPYVSLKHLDCWVAYKERAKVILTPVMWSTKSATDRLADIKASLTNLNIWYECIYCGILKNKQAELLLAQAMIRKDNPNQGTRELKLYILALFHVMITATKDVDTYALDTYAAMLKYIEASMNKYV
jgi:hypothetical protein